MQNTEQAECYEVGPFPCAVMSTQPKLTHHVISLNPDPAMQDLVVVRGSRRSKAGGMYRVTQYEEHILKPKLCSVGNKT